jgi:hypothetical protein
MPAPPCNAIMRLQSPTNYVAFWDMWRTSRLTPSLREI